VIVSFTNLAIQRGPHIVDFTAQKTGYLISQASGVTFVEPRQFDKHKRCATVCSTLKSLQGWLSYAELIRVGTLNISKRLSHHWHHATHHSHFQIIHTRPPYSVTAPVRSLEKGPIGDKSRETAEHLGSSHFQYLIGTDWNHRLPCGITTSGQSQDNLEKHTSLIHIIPHPVFVERLLIRIGILQNPIPSIVKCHFTQSAHVSTLD
jgi:hypothetical protein